MYLKADTVIQKLNVKLSVYIEFHITFYTTPQKRNCDLLYIYYIFLYD